MASPSGSTGSPPREKPSGGPIIVDTSGLNLTPEQAAACKVVFQEIAHQAFDEKLRGNVYVIIPYDGAGKVGILKIERYFQVLPVAESKKRGP